MEQTLQQVGELLLGSIPTVIFMILLYWLYKVLVHNPLEKVLHERHDKTQGAVEKAQADIAAAAARTAEYEQRLREARVAVFRSQETRRQQATHARATALAQARERAQAQLQQAHAVIEKEKIAAQENLQAETGRLAAEIIRTVLHTGSSPAPAGGAR